MTRIAVIGGFGQLGSDLVTRLGDRAIAVGHADIDITDRDQVHTELDRLQPQFVINCAAYNLVDKAEEDCERAFAVNKLGPQHLARWCARADVSLLHVSTDYVFGLDAQRRTPYVETDKPGPISAYGWSKLAGEQYVSALCPQHFIVRTCGLYGRHAARGKGNFVETMLRLGAERPELRIVADQWCTPTSTADLADALIALIDTEAYGLYHATSSDACTWAEFATEIFRLAGLPTRVIPITAREYGAKAARPDYSVLDCSKLTALLGRPMRSWRAALAEHLAAR